VQLITPVRTYWSSTQYLGHKKSSNKATFYFAFKRKRKILAYIYFFTVLVWLGYFEKKLWKGL
jgi:hypothetical protein